MAGLGECIPSGWPPGGGWSDDTRGSLEDDQTMALRARWGLYLTRAHLENKVRARATSPSASSSAKRKTQCHRTRPGSRAETSL